MKAKKDNGIAGIDVIIALIAITLFSTLIVSMMYSNVMENIKLKKETLAMIYMTEIFENVGIEDYDNLPIGNYEDIISKSYDEKIEKLIPDTMIDGFEIDIVITDELEGVTENEDILKKIQLTISYEVGNRTFNNSIQRMKIKE